MAGTNSSKSKFCHFFLFCLVPGWAGPALGVLPHRPPHGRDGQPAEPRWATPPTRNKIPAPGRALSESPRAVFSAPSHTTAARPTPRPAFHASPRRAARVAGIRPCHHGRPPAPAGESRKSGEPAARPTPAPGADPPAANNAARRAKAVAPRPNPRAFAAGHGIALGRRDPGRLEPRPRVKRRAVGAKLHADDAVLRTRKGKRANHGRSRERDLEERLSGLHLQPAQTRNGEAAQPFEPAPPPAYNAPSSKRFLGLVLR